MRTGRTYILKTTDNAWLVGAGSPTGCVVTGGGSEPSISGYALYSHPSHKPYGTLVSQLPLIAEWTSHGISCEPAYGHHETGQLGYTVVA